MSVKEFYDLLNEALTEEAVEHRDQARAIILDIADALGLDMSQNVEGDDVWSHTNMLRVVRGVAQLQTSLHVHKGTHGGLHRFR